jgi:hypothetical protein
MSGGKERLDADAPRAGLVTVEQRVVSVEPQLGADCGADFALQLEHFLE